MLIFGDLGVFSVFFLTFAYYRGLDPALYHRSSATLSPVLGSVNTLLMLTSSWFVATALHLARQARQAASRRCFALGLACGLAFVGVKFIEYGEKFSSGINLTTNDFYMFYFVLTCIHLLHVLIGIAVLAFLMRQVSADALHERRIQHLESGASFWHLVDLLWIVLFGLLYLAS